MTVWTDPELLTLARLCSAAYIPNNKAAVEALGVTWFGQADNTGCQATVVEWMGRVGVVFSGTHVGKNPNPIQLLDNIDGTAIHPLAKPEFRVARGYWQPLDDLWGAIGALCPTAPMWFSGHSLGGAHAHLARILMPGDGEDVVSFGAPCCADLQTWWWLYSEERPFRIVHEKDFAPAWRPALYAVQPGPMEWLHDGDMKLTYLRPGEDISIADHSIDNGYIPALEALCQP